MKGPFPGMDPYLEVGHPWRGFHTRLLTHLSDDLQPLLLPRYMAFIEERVLLGPLSDPLIPDVSVREQDVGGTPSRGGVAAPARPSLDVTEPEIIEVPDLTVADRYVVTRDVESREIVTAMEVLSPWNKTGKGLEQYREKQEEYLRSATSLVEIDLLRGGQHAVAVPKERLKPSDYRVCVHRAESCRFEVVRFGLREPLPSVAIPLRYEDLDVALRLGAAFDKSFEGGAYAYALQYAGNPPVPLASADAQWAREQIRRWQEERSAGGA